MSEQIHKEFLTRSLKRLYDEINSAQQRADYSSIEGFVPYLVEAQNLANEIYPTNPILKKIRSDSYVGLKTASYHSANLTSSKMRLLQLIDAIGIDIVQMNMIPSPISVNITQNQTAMLHNYQSFQTILSNINQLPLSADDKIKTEKLVRDFENEATLPVPDKGKLKSILLAAGSLSKEVALMLLANGLDKGVLTFPTLF